MPTLDVSYMVPTSINQNPTPYQKKNKEVYTVKKKKEKEKSVTH